MNKTLTYVCVYIYMCVCVCVCVYVCGILGDGIIFRNFPIHFEDHNTFIALKSLSLTVFW
jgi:hypothetical protein